MVVQDVRKFVGRARGKWPYALLSSVLYVVVQQFGEFYGIL